MKKLCPFCNRLNVKKNGFYTNRKQRWYCLECKRSFHWENKKAKTNNERVWFEKWIKEGYSVRQLTDQSGHKRDKLYSIINRCLSAPPLEKENDLSQYKHFVFDGTFLYRPKSIVVLMDAKTNSVISGRYGISENSIPQLLAFFEPLKEKGLSPLSFTVDGNPQVIKLLGQLWPEAVIQRCLVHIQRQGLMWCRHNPKRTDAKKLRDIFLLVPYIRSHKAKDLFLEELYSWESHYGPRIDSRPERGRVFSDLKKARSMLLKALPNMFYYLEDSNIPFSTNGVEGYFSRLKSHYRSHRGLEKQKRKNYFEWYFYYRPK